MLFEQEAAPEPWLSHHHSASSQFLYSDKVVVAQELRRRGGGVGGGALARPGRESFELPPEWPNEPLLVILLLVRKGL